jgi:hypothetical protein
LADICSLLEESTGGYLEFWSRASKPLEVISLL